MRLLSVDWDFFFPVPSPREDLDFLYDWGHAETGSLMLNGIWPIRAAQFIDQGIPLPGTSGEEETFWDRFRFSEAPVLFYADSHSLIYRPEVLHKVHEVLNFDAHHDAYESKGEVLRKKQVNCGNWATALKLHHIDVRVVYPRWDAWMMEDNPHVEVYPEVDRGFHHRRKFDKVFLCRSGTWTPSWLEDKFWEFLDRCPIQTKVKLDDIDHRVFHLEEAQGVAEMVRKAREDKINDYRTTSNDPEDV